MWSLLRNRYLRRSRPISLFGSCPKRETVLGLQREKGRSDADYIFGFKTLLSRITNIPVIRSERWYLCRAFVRARRCMVPHVAGVSRKVITRISGRRTRQRRERKRSLPRTATRLSYSTSDWRSTMYAIRERKVAKKEILPASQRSFLSGTGRGTVFLFSQERKERWWGALRRSSSLSS